MKIVGIILIVLQVIALLGGGIPSAGVGSAYAFGYYLGYFAPGIIGAVLLIIGLNKKK